MDSYKKPDEELSADEQRNYVLSQKRILDEWTAEGRKFLEFSANKLGPLNQKITDNIVGYLRMLKDCVGSQERVSERMGSSFNAEVSDTPNNVTLITAKKGSNKQMVYNKALGKNVRPIELD